jgi:predicted signal transduction protein with EAL and GGDEF domain
MPIQVLEQAICSGKKKKGVEESMNKNQKQITILLLILLTSVLLMFIGTYNDIESQPYSYKIGLPELLSLVCAVWFLFFVVCFSGLKEKKEG